MSNKNLLTVAYTRRDMLRSIFKSLARQTVQHLCGTFSNKPAVFLWGLFKLKQHKIFPKFTPYVHTIHRGLVTIWSFVWAANSVFRCQQWQLRIRQFVCLRCRQDDWAIFWGVSMEELSCFQIILIIEWIKDCLLFVELNCTFGERSKSRITDA
jgi:hypothetical protein